MYGLDLCLVMCKLANIMSIIDFINCHVDTLICYLEFCVSTYKVNTLFQLSNYNFFNEYLKFSSNLLIFFILCTCYYCKFKIEEPHSRKDLPQCHRCQGYGHTKTYCNRDPRCVHSCLSRL